MDKDKDPSEHPALESTTTATITATTTAMKQPREPLAVPLAEAEAEAVAAKTRPSAMVHSAVNPFLYPAASSAKKSSPHSSSPSYQVQMRGAIPCQGCRVRREPLITSQEVGTVEWGVHEGDSVSVQGCPVQGPPFARDNDSFNTFALHASPGETILHSPTPPLLYNIMYITFEYTS
jgi:hypothetical protein